MNENEIGTYTGEVCNRNNCKGVITVEEPYGSCSCHTNPPCSFCVDKDYYCELCGWSYLEEWQAKQKEHVKQNKERWKEENRLYDEREELFWQKYRGEIAIDKYEARVIGHTHFSQKIYGIFQPGTETRETIRVKANGTFGGRFLAFTDHCFIFIAYTD